MALSDLAGLAEEIYHRTHPPAPSSDDDDRFEERCVQLGTTLGGAGRVEGDLTPGATHALSTVLDALGKKTGPEDTRTAAQRRHDALEEACRRLIGAAMVPGRAGQPTQLTVHMTLNQLRGLPAASDAERVWAAAQAATGPGWLTGPAADAAACDATITPVVTGHLDPTALDALTRWFHASHPPPGPGAVSAAADETPFTAEPGTSFAPGTRDRLRRALLGLAIQALSGPAGLAAHLRTTLTNPTGTTRTAGGTLAGAGHTPAPAGGTLTLPAAALSLPLDIGAATVTIPAHLRKAAAIRHHDCAFPGCQVPFTACDLHHLIPRSHGGPTSLVNLLPLCHFHHQIAIHRWHWTLQLHPDGTTTATSPDRSRIYHSHGPPGRSPPHQAA